MACTGTTNYGWCQPAVGGDSGAWGTELNGALVAIDSTVFAVSGVANAALPKAGGTMTGRIDGVTSTMQSHSWGNVSGALSFSNASAQYHIATVVGAVTSFAITGVPAVATSVQGVVFKLTNAGAFSITWGSAFKWPGGVIPTLTASGTDLLAFITDDQGTTWRLIGIQLNLH